MILTLFIIGAASIVFGVYNLAKEKNLLGFFFIFSGFILLFIGYFVLHLYPQTMPEFLRNLRI
jgi:hypothetical protein